MTEPRRWRHDGTTIPYIIKLIPPGKGLSGNAHSAVHHLGKGVADICVFGFDGGGLEWYWSLLVGCRLNGLG